MKTWEMIKELTEHPDKEFIRKVDGLHIKTNGNGEMIWDSGYQFMKLDHEWEEIKRPVDFMTAIQSGKEVSVQYSGANYKKMNLPNLFYELQQDYSDRTIRQFILNGKWFIED